MYFRLYEILCEVVDNLKEYLNSSKHMERWIPKKMHKTAGKRFAIKLFPRSSKRTIVSTFRYNFIDLYKFRPVVLHSY